MNKLQTKIGWEPHKAQKEILASKSKDIVICAGRRFGKSALCAYVILETLVNNILDLRDGKDVKPAKIWIVAPNYDLTDKVFEYLSRYFMKVFPDWSRNISTRVPAFIKTPFGAEVRCKSADNPTSLLGEELDLLVIDECSRIKKSVYETHLYPTTTSRPNCRRFFISCIIGDSYVISDKGLKKVSSFPFSGKIGKEQKYTELLYGKSGMDKIGYLWENESMNTIRITTEGGYNLEGTYNHPIIARDTIYKKFGTWTELSNITKNHFALLQLNQQVFGNNDKLKYSFKRNGYHKKLNIPKETNKDFAYFIGLLLGDGYVGKRDLTIITQDQEIIDFCRNNKFGLNFSEYDDNGTLKLRAGSDEFIAILESLGYEKIKAKFKKIPDNCLEWSKENICSLLSGLFDTDGCCDIRKNGKSRISFASTSEEMIKQVQLLLLNLGIASSLTKQTIKPTKKVKVSSVVYKIEICDQRAVKRFKEQIGFRIKRKEDKLSFELKKYQRQYIKRDNCEFLWKRITKIEKSKNKTFDFNIPVSHNFFSNGFISHNTPFGKNWFHDEWQRAKEHGGAFQFSSLDGVSVTPEAFEDSRKRLPTDVFEQEFLAIFKDSYSSVFRNVKNCIDPALEGGVEPKMGHRYVMGVDLAKFRDFTVLTVVDKGKHEVVFLDRFQKLPYTLQKERIKVTARKYGTQIIMDAMNVGASIGDDLRALGLSVIDFKATGTKSPDWDKKGTKELMIDKLSSFIQERNIRIPPNDVLIDELEAFGYELSESGNVKYCAPPGLHDDCVTSLGLAVWTLKGKAKLEVIKAARSMPLKKRVFQYK